MELIRVQTNIFPIMVTLFTEVKKIPIGIDSYPIIVL